MEFNYNVDIYLNSKSTQLLSKYFNICLICVCMKEIDNYMYTDKKYNYMYIHVHVYR